MPKTRVWWPLLVATIVIAGLFSRPVFASSCNKTVSQVFEEVAPSVVRIFTIAIDPFSLTKRVNFGVGSGFVIDDDGHVVTNAHVVHGTNEILIETSDNKTRKAEIVGTDPISDLAVIKLKGSGIALQKAQLGKSGTLSIGEDVLAIGFPLGLEKTASRGIISGKERVIPLSPMSWLVPFIQTDAAISPGNSGGPLVNLCGEVIGVNTLVAQKGQNINFSIPVDTVRELTPQLIKNGRVMRAWHGINGSLVPPQMSFVLHVAPGYLVETIEPGSPAEKVGLRGGTFRIIFGSKEYLLGGDVITHVNDVRLTNLDKVIHIARSLKVGDTITLKYWRKGKVHTAEVVLPERPILPGDVRRFH